MTEEMILWEGDKLDRTSEGNFLYKYLVNRYNSAIDEEFESLVLNIDDSWGLGKTFFLSRWEVDLIAKGHPVVSFNAWNSDFQNDPLIAFITEIENQLTEYFKRSKTAKELVRKTFMGGARLLKNSIPLLSAILLKQFSGISIDKIQELINGDEPFDIDSLYSIDDDPQDGGDSELDGTDEKLSDKDPIVKSFVSLLSMYGKESLEKYIAQKRDIKTFRINFSKLVKYVGSKLKTKKLPIFIIIDELDRCRPNYAIELLESIKHLFSIKGVYFILATDTQQLCHSIKVIYGNDFDSSRYLNRFFDQTYEFQKSDNNTYAKYLFDRYKILDKAPFLFSPLQDIELLETGDPNIEIFSTFSSYFNLTLRDQEQIISHLYTICLTWSESGGSLHSPIIIFLLMLRHNSKEQFELFKTKKYDILNCRKINSIYEKFDSSFVIEQYKREPFDPGQRRRNREKETLGVEQIIDSYRYFIINNLKTVMENNAGAGTPIFIDNIQNDCIKKNTTGSTITGNMNETDVLSLMSYYEIVKQVGHLIKDKKFEGKVE